jgi:hypothetical protein
VRRGEDREKGEERSRAVQTKNLEFGMSTWLEGGMEQREQRKEEN